MSRSWIGTGLTGEALNQRIDDSLRQVYEVSTKGIVSDREIVNSSRSYLFVDGNQLKFYNAGTKKVTTVTTA